MTTVAGIVPPRRSRRQLVRRIRLTGAGLASLLAASGTPQQLSAHDVSITSMARVFVDEVSQGRYVLSVIDAGLPPLSAATPVLLPGHCRLVEPPSPDSAARASSLTTVTFDCDRVPAPDDEVVLPWRLAGVVVVLRALDGSDSSAFFRGRGDTVPVRFGDLGAGTASRLHLAARYSLLGAEHILFGIDHLLFVLGLLLLVRGVGTLVATITAFTVAHSITLGAAVLGLVTIDRAAVEAAIALSIVLLAREVVVGRRSDRSLLRERPWLVAFGFGLLHGFGFAGALGEIGLRSADIPFALFSFNVGVEVGQLAFVAAVLVTHALTREALGTHRRRVEPIVGYALGAVATLWFFERLPGLWGG